MEFVGTFFLVLTIALAVTAETAAVTAPLAIGIVLMVMVYMWGHVSWAHYNPAVTTALIVRNKISLPEGLTYMVFQILWALVAVALWAIITWWAGLVPAPGADYSMGAGFLAEFLFTFALASVVLHTAATKAVEGNSFYGFAIWGTVLAAAYAAGGVSWWAFNPAGGLWPRLYSMFTGGGWFSHVWMLYVLAPLLWWVVAGLFHGMTVGEEK